MMTMIFNHEPEQHLPMIISICFAKGYHHFCQSSPSSSPLEVKLVVHLLLLVPDGSHGFSSTNDWVNMEPAIGLQTTIAAFVLAVYLFLQVLAWPWKAPPLTAVRSSGA